MRLGCAALWWCAARALLLEPGPRCPPPRGGGRRRSCESVCADAALPRHANLGVRGELPPCVHHVVADADYETLAAALAAETRLPAAYIQELADLGAIYFAPAHADLPRGLRRLTRARDLRRAAPMKSYCRVHQNPRRRFEALAVDWPGTVLAETDDFLVVHKPGGVAMQAGVDNQVENVVFQLQRALRRKQLWVVGRLDASTTGACVLAKSAAAAARLNKAWADSEKTYVCLTQTPVRLGRLEHAFKKGEKAHRNSKPTLLRLPDDALDAAVWKRAALDVLSCAAVQVDAAALAGVSGNDGPYYEVAVRLVTGRTHQIRLQLSAENAPLVGDTRYGPAAGLLDDDDAAHGDGSSLLGPQADRVALHCRAVDFGAGAEAAGLPPTVACPDPWWRRATPGAQRVVNASYS